MTSIKIERSAIFSECRTWRYTLERYWDKEKPFALFILLNPSTADETHDDPTNRRGIKFAQDWDYGGCVFCNLFAFRTPYPKELKKQECNMAVGPGNWGIVEEQCRKAGIIVCAWGTHGNYFDMGQHMVNILRAFKFNLYHMGLTKHGYPKHILYLKGDTKPELWEENLSRV